MYTGNTIKNNKSVLAGIPIADDIFPGTIKAAVYNTENSQWEVQETVDLSSFNENDYNTIVNSGALPVLLSDHSGPVVLVTDKEMQATAYFDDGTVFSSSQKAELQLNIAITEREFSRLYPEDIGEIEISYTDIDNQTITTQPIKMLYENKIVYCYDTPLQLDDNFTVNSVTIRLYGADGSPLTDITLAVDQLIRRGQKYAIFAQCDAAAIAAPETFSFLESSSMGFESASLAGEGLIQKSADNYTYSYFLKDHLGSTRMVLDEDGSIKEALMYQPYGTVSDVDGISAPMPDPLREKFTGKEYDEDGDGNGASGIQAYHFGFRFYDPEVGVWNRPDPMDEFWNAYSYTGDDPINFIDPTGLKVDWDKDYDEKKYEQILGSGGLEDIADYVNSETDYTFEQMYSDWLGGQNNGGDDNDAGGDFGNRLVSRGAVYDLKSYQDYFTGRGSMNSNEFFEDWKLAIKYTYGNMEIGGKSHYNRNEFTHYKSPDKVISDPSLFKHGPESNRYHLPGQKYTSDNNPFGADEYVILDGKHTTDQSIIGTHNYGQNFVTHFFLDMVLYYPLGNSINDPTTWNERVFK